MWVIFLLLALCLRAGAADLFHDDFSHFSPGWLTNPVGRLNAAIQEYHYLPNRGVPLGRWENAICHLDAWIIGDEDGKSYIEQHLTPDSNQFQKAIFLTGDPEWSDYTVESRVKPLALENLAGIVFRYHTNRHYYLFTLDNGKARLALHLPLEKEFRVPEFRELGSAAFPFDTKRYYALKVENSGPSIRCFIDGRLILQAADSEILKGKAGITATGPARFQDFGVQASDETIHNIESRIGVRETDLARLRAENPQPKLWKKFATPEFGAGRNVRFGDLDGDGQIDMLIAQNIPHVKGDSFDVISCLTAVNLDGKILWQIGRPDSRHGLLTNDTPFQIHDIDGDGRNEVVLVKDFKLQILDGRTGEVKRWAWMPVAPASKERPYQLVNGDSIAFVNLSRDNRRHEILVKDRYEHFWIFNNNLEVLVRGEGQTGHYPYPVNMDDGSDQITIGYSLWDHNGRQLWSHDRDLRDHADGIMVGNLSGDTKAEARVYLSGSDEGFVMFDIRGNILKHVRAGHTQSPSVAKYRMDVPGLQYASINFWKNPGIVSCLIGTATLEQGEPIHTGAPMLPVNWRGDGQEFILLSGNPREGGMIDGHLRRAVMFPDDRHPDLAANVLDLTGAWDEHNRVDQRSFDRILERFLTEHGATFVVDNGAFTFLPLWHYLLENRALEYLQEHHCKIYVHTMITGDQALLDTLNGFRELAASAQQLNFVVWVN